MVETVRPDDTATETTDREVQLVDDRPTAVWKSRPWTASEKQRAVSEGELTDVARATTVLDANIAYLALTAPTAAQVAAQVKALTKQANRTIRYTLGQVHEELFDSMDGT